MLITESEYKATLTSKFIDVTENAMNTNPDEFERYVESNLINDLGRISIQLIYETSDSLYRHIVFKTEKHNVHYVVIISLKSNVIIGHYVLDLNKEYGI